MRLIDIPSSEPRGLIVHSYVLCGSENKQRLFPYTALTDRFLWPRRSVFTARYGLDVYIWLS